VSLGSGLELLGEVFVFLIFVSEKDESVLLLSENGLDLVLSESEESGDHQGFVPGRKRFLVGNTSENVDVGLELSEEDLTRLGSSEFFGASSVVGVDKNDFIFNISNWVVGSGEKSIRLFSEVGKDKLAVINLLLETGAVNGRAWRSALLEDPGHDSVLGSSTSVLGGLAILEELQSGETLDAESLCELLLLGGIDLGKGVGWIVV
jgi:hypothetical protein